jgi:hypothetical protein
MGPHQNAAPRSIYSPHLDASIATAILECGCCKNFGPTHVRSLLAPVTRRYILNSLLGTTSPCHREKEDSQRSAYMPMSTPKDSGCINRSRQLERTQWTALGESPKGTWHRGHSWQTVGAISTVKKSANAVMTWELNFTSSPRTPPGSMASLKGQTKYYSTPSNDSAHQAWERMTTKR